MTRRHRRTYGRMALYKYVYLYLSLTKEVIFYLCRFVCLCLSVRQITQKVMNEFNEVFGG